MKKGILFALIGILLLTGIFVCRDFTGSPGETVTIVIPEGSTAAEIVSLLKENKVISFSPLFSRYIRNDAQNLKAGVHVFTKKMGYRDTLAELMRNVPMENAIAVTIPEGYEVREIAVLLESAGVCSSDAFLSACENAKNTFSFLPDDGNVEGYLFPATYEFLPDTAGAVVVNTMVETFRDKLFTEENRKAAQMLSMDFHEVLTLASIIEREAAKAEERDVVSSVFHNRLKNNMHLESCATVQYILKERKKVLSVSDTKIQSPYNTYQNAGLPPAPIACPGEASVKAALHPAKTDYLFFVADGNGGHIFSKTYAEHIREMKNHGL